ncbi:hypothetical protein COW36_16975 [bacterium (Candidatus Blackallbacteria) CG17_big_fil_post_rev_8_21_14_2_50_48_46]|uniref:Uncharacterized protein n=1 Tax=bacterium (Candidatus Blackallbacteria) CG17_big_fil_post_rev_8_21_14_2_50_48_46 TaxID=2014261 RepID=A0A2M7G1D0_9BACT|nr:MAG: hypothetical protein COW64_09285 [bacterium (Candidatus Blackallbacteria) CG18_big_fil_WC_8_21_14_2_50_49_26]PIW15496.1 MAG: hypothetical protein COW36_16975 [bacterium (Candidatus Blackallbacteria) CG17_big_fil_post_rev_8_21_14_2_50_48_46]PIW48604.1 MAG: hypothetical protein COW20_08870 [bacterium (Candidatus Blackallbacteria) CG13_big_fil_rev_8_21_14_2_50_49_14]
MRASFFSQSLLVLSLLSFTACGSLPNLPSPAQLNAQSIQATSQPQSPPIHLRIKQAEIEISSQELNQQFQSILALSNEKRLKDTVLQTLPGGVLQAKGKLDASQYLPNIPFQMTGSLSVRPGNIIRYEATDIRVVGVPVKGLLDIFGLELANLAKFKDRFGRIEQKGNAFHLIVEKFTKDAVIEGQMRQVNTSANAISVIF